MRTLSCCGVNIVFKGQRNLSSVFRFKDRLPHGLVSGVVYKFQCGTCDSSYYSETDRPLEAKTAEHIGISPLTFNKVKTTSHFVNICLLLMIS